MLHRKGFTILELLVVIAIISILAAVVLVALTQSRQKGNDAAIVSQLAEARKESQLYYDNHGGSYCSQPNCDPWGGSDGTNTAYCGERPNMVFDDSMVPDPNTIGRFITAAEALAPIGSAENNTMCFLDDAGRHWAIAMKLNYPANGWWCIDSYGNSKLLPGTNQEVRDSINGNIISRTCPQNAQ
jgi:prepilin-type N-terminal cleavage/methylation domain-containing protein